MTFALPHDPFRLAAALLVRAGAGSALTALVLLVLASSATCRPAGLLRGATSRAAAGEEVATLAADERAARPRSSLAEPSSIRAAPPSWTAPVVVHAGVTADTLRFIRGP